MEGVKHDEGKTRWDLVPWDAARAVAEILTFGAAKYGDRNWEKGLRPGRLFAACLRHLAADALGEKQDPESGKLHLAHAACNLMMLLHFALEDHEALVQPATLDPTVRTDDPGSDVTLVCPWPPSGEPVVCVSPDPHRCLVFAHRPRDDEPAFGIRGASACLGPEDGAGPPTDLPGGC